MKPLSCRIPIVVKRRNLLEAACLNFGILSCVGSHVYTGLGSKKGKSRSLLRSRLKLILSAVAEWTDLTKSPGSGGFKLAYIALLDENDKPSSVVSVEKPLKIRLIYHIGVPNLGARCTLSFFTQGPESS